MVVSKLATRSSGNAGQYSSRGGRKIDRFIVHHAATSNLDVVLSMMRTGSREVSSNYVISNGGEIISVVPEQYRAWTSASPAWDGRAVTVEVVNSKVGDPWPISAKAQEALSKLIADVATRYKFTPKRDGKNSTVIGHRELYTWFGESYATACPGGINLAAVTKRAAQLTTTGDDDLTPTQANQLKQIYAAIFQGGGSMLDGGKSISRSLAEINTPITRSNAAKPTTVSSKKVKIPVRQDNADTNTLVRKLEKDVAALTKLIETKLKG